MSETDTGAPSPAVPTKDERNASSWPGDAVYRRSDLFLKTLQVVLTGVGFFFVLEQIETNSKQLQNSSEQLRNSTEQLRNSGEQLRYSSENWRHSVRSAVWDYAFAFDRMLVENPGLYPYFLDGKSLPDGQSLSEEDADLHASVIAAAIMTLDVFEASMSQEGVLTKEEADDWKEWMIDMFASSPVLRDTLSSRSDWYSSRLQERADAALIRMQEIQATGSAPSRRAR